MHKTQLHLKDDIQRCIEACSSCHDDCLEAVPHCLSMGGAHAEPGHVRLLLDCAEICQTAASFMLRHSDLHERTCLVCADVCDACATACERFDDPRMKSCAASCRECADACRRTAAIPIAA